MINCVVIGVLGGIGLVLTHYMLQWGTRHGVRAVVPDFQSLTLEQAQSLAIEGDLNLIINDSTYAPSRKRGSILDQIPPAGTLVKPGRSIYLTVNATQQSIVDVPYVAGRSLRQAKNMLDVASLTIKELIYEDDIATNYILAQYCDEEEVMERSHTKAVIGTGITLKVGVDEAHKETTTPSLIGKTLALAQNTLWDTGLNVGELSDFEPIEESERRLAYVIFQSHPADSLITRGERIDLKLSQHRYMVDTVLKHEMMARKERELILFREKEIADSLAMTLIDSMDIVEIVPETLPQPKVRAERVEFEDLFN